MTHLVPVLRPVLGSPFRRASLYRAAGEMPSWHIAPVRTGTVTDLISGSQIITFTNSSPAWGFDSSGVLVQPAANVPFIEYDPATGANLGWRVWDAVANLLLRSEEFNTTWTTFRGSITPNAIAAPNGATTADKLVEDTTANNTHGSYQFIAVANGTQYTFSVFAKAGERTAMSIRAGLTGGEINAAFFNLSTGAVISTGTGYTAQVVNAGNGWYRCAVAATSSVTSSVFVVTTAIGGSNSYTGDGTSGVYPWGAQLNTGPLAPYVPTGALAASSTADVASILSWAAANNIRSAYIRGRTTASGTRGLLSGNDNTSSNRIEAITSGTDPRLQVTTIGSSVADINGGTIAANTPFRMAMRFAPDSYALSVNGGAVVTDAIGALPTIDRWFLGRTQAGGYANGYIEEMALFTGLISDSRLPATSAS
jgi:hypothetical protein